MEFLIELMSSSSERSKISRLKIYKVFFHVERLILRL